MTDESELKPCPFCGQEPQSNTLNAWCNGSIDNPHGAINLQRAAWNTRPAHESELKPVADTAELRALAEWLDRSSIVAKVWNKPGASAAILSLLDEVERLRAKVAEGKP